MTVIDENVNPGALLDEIPLKPLETTGSVYLNDKWELGNVQLKNGLAIENYPLKYDLENDQMEIKTDEGIKILYSWKIDEFKFLDRGEVFTNVDNFENSTEYEGFFLVMSSGQASVLKYFESRLIPANYVPTTDTGRKYDKIVKEEKYMISIGDVVYELSGKGKKDIGIFRRHAEEISEFVEKEDISFKKESDLVNLMNYYNTL